MSRQPCHRADGLTKAAYRKRSAARQAAKRTNLHPDLGRLVAYKCRDCGWYHVGHNR